jgi:hypothetical protein
MAEDEEDDEEAAPVERWPASIWARATRLRKGEGEAEKAGLEEGDFVGGFADMYVRRLLRWCGGVVEHGSCCCVVTSCAGNAVAVWADPMR